MEYDDGRKKQNGFVDAAVGSFAGTLAANMLIYYMFSPDKDGMSRFDKIFRKNRQSAQYQPDRKDI